MKGLLEDEDKVIDSRDAVSLWKERFHTKERG